MFLWIQNILKFENKKKIAVTEIFHESGLGFSVFVYMMGSVFVLCAVRTVSDSHDSVIQSVMNSHDSVIHSLLDSHDSVIQSMFDSHDSVSKGFTCFSDSVSNGFTRFSDSDQSVLLFRCVLCLSLWTESVQLLWITNGETFSPCDVCRKNTFHVCNI